MLHGHSPHTAHAFVLLRTPMSKLRTLNALRNMCGSITSRTCLAVRLSEERDRSRQTRKETE